MSGLQAALRALRRVASERHVVPLVIEFVALFLHGSLHHPRKVCKPLFELSDVSHQNGMSFL